MILDAIRLPSKKFTRFTPPEPPAFITHNTEYNLHLVPNGTSCSAAVAVLQDVNTERKSVLRIKQNYDSNRIETISTIVLNPA